LGGKDSNSITVHVPESHVVDLELVKIGFTEQTRQRLSEKYSRILNEISLELSRKQAFLFPAIDRYLASPTPSNWVEVKAAAQDTAARIRASMDDEVEYKSQETLIDYAKYADSLLQSSSTFTEAIDFHGSRLVTFNHMPPGDSPPKEQVLGWEDALEKQYTMMQAQLRELVAKFQG
jgi:hypothetical protein